MAVFDDAIQPAGDEQIFEEPAATTLAASEETQAEPPPSPPATPHVQESRPVIRSFSDAIDGRISAAELAKLLGVQVHDVILTAKTLGFNNVTAGTALVADLAEKIAARHRALG